MRTRGPILTICAVAAAGTAIWLANVSHDHATTAQVLPAVAVPAVAVPAATSPAPPPPPVTPPVQFPRRADYKAEIGVRNGAIGLTITVAGAQTTAYACDNEGIEVWLKGRTGPGTLALASWDGASRLDGRLEGDHITGTLRIGEKTWQFRSSAAEVPANGY
jgi:hypothetical protein